MESNQKCLGHYLSTWRNKFIMRISGISYGDGFRSFGRIVFRNYAGKGRIKIGVDVKVNSFDGGANPGLVAARSMLIATASGSISIGNRVVIDNSVLFSAVSVIVGDDTRLSPGCKIFDTDFHSSNPEYRLNGNTHVPTKPVMIGRQVFLGANVTVLKGVTIGDGAVVGAGSVVTRNIPAREIWAGNPAKFIKNVENYDTNI